MEQISALLQRGLTDDEIAQEVGLSVVRVRVWRTRLGVRYQSGPPRPTEADIAHIDARLQEGWPSSEITEETGWSFHVISKVDAGRGLVSRNGNAYASIKRAEMLAEKRRRVTP